MVLLASSFDQSKYMNANSLVSEKAVRIKDVTAEMVRRGSGQEKRPVLWFANHEKGLVLNTTNLRTLQGDFGDDMSKWKEKIIVVYPTKVDFAGKVVGGLRIRIPPPKQAVAGNGQPTKPKGAQEALNAFAAQPEPKPAPKDDLDDEIGF
jgi:hypothetical protein